MKNHKGVKAMTGLTPITLKGLQRIRELRCGAVWCEEYRNGGGELRI